MYKFIFKDKTWTADTLLALLYIFKHNIHNFDELRKIEKVRIVYES